MKKRSYKVVILKTTLPKTKTKKQESISKPKKKKTRKYYREFYRFLKQNLLKLKPRRQESVVFSPSSPS